MSSEAKERLADLLRDVERTVREITDEARAKVRPGRYVPNPTPWTSQAEKSDNWPKRWIPRNAMCSATSEGDGSGEGHESNPGFRACTRLHGHRDIRDGDNREHMWGPERYSAERALSAANRIATEEWQASAAVMADEFSAVSS